jgi:hypothetical protein
MGGLAFCGLRSKRDQRLEVFKVQEMRPAGSTCAPANVKLAGNLSELIVRKRSPGEGKIVAVLLRQRGPLQRCSNSRGRPDRRPHGIQW